MVKDYSLKNNTKLSEHFKSNEFACKDGSDLIKIDDVLITQLEMLRNTINKPIKIVSGYRTESYNKSCGGATNSYHLQGRAADISVDGIDPILLALVCVEMGFSGVGCYSDFVHVDTRPIPKKWLNKGGTNIYV